MELFDVVAVDFDTLEVSIIAENKTDRNAEAIEKMAVMRRGLESEFFATVPAGKYKNGDNWDN